MQTKLTLRLDEDIVKRAKAFSQESGKSLSQIVSDYFGTLTSKSEQSYEVNGPLTKSLRGILRQSNLSLEDYHRYLKGKYL